MRHVSLESRSEFEELVESGWHHQTHIIGVPFLILCDLDSDLKEHGLQIAIGHSVQDPGQFAYRIEQSDQAAPAECYTDCDDPNCPYTH